MNLVPDSGSYPLLKYCLLLFFLVFILIRAPTKAPVKNRFSFVMVITIKTVLKERVFVLCPSLYITLKWIDLNLYQKLLSE